MELNKIHWVLGTKRSPRLKPYITRNTCKRKGKNSPFQKEFSLLIKKHYIKLT